MKKYTKVGAKSRKNKKNKTHKFHKKIRKTMRLKKVGSGFLSNISSAVSNAKSGNYMPLAEIIKREGEKTVEGLKKYPDELNKSIVQKALQIADKYPKIIEQIEKKQPGAIADLREIAELGPTKYYDMKESRERNQGETHIYRDTVPSENQKNPPSINNGSIPQISVDAFDTNVPSDTPRVNAVLPNTIHPSNEPKSPEFFSKIVKQISEYEKTVNQISDEYSNAINA